jgi:hypothetical protein
MPNADITYQAPGSSTGRGGLMPRPYQQAAVAASETSTSAGSAPRSP